MNDVRLPHEPRLSDEHLDGVLTAFFQAEIPDPWPIMKVPPPSPQPRTAGPPWWHRTSRLALAASIGFLFTGYLSLASIFPHAEVNDEPDRPLKHGRDISYKQPRHKQLNGPAANPVRMHTPDGREVLIWEQKDKDGGFTLKAEFSKENR